ncbi:STAS domain-containing protein [Ammoniphilus sp. CFH 90114]|uniref:STAS domain-containing protein n=1 Tax=Ammoniphilus sp. CFH 90114 TaxID=2493665 RepID=UPI00100FEB87|nr:STAS domain-containing protein [Ammoniphilus sp. CFH 90114]RXT15544.1 anti-sigma factor antagonist [Ammoniphilus sp. CFH 90114]
MIKQAITEEGYYLLLMGELDLSMAEKFNEVVEPLAKEIGKKLTINLKELKYLDSTGIGIFVALIKIRESMDAPFIIQDVPPKIQRLFDITGISKFLTIEQSKQERKEG